MSRPESGVDPSDFEVGGGYVYFKYFKTVIEIHRIPTSDGPTERVTVPVDTETIGDIAVSSDGSFVVYASTNLVAAAPASGGDAQAIAGISAYAVVADAAFAYYFHAVNSAQECEAGTHVYRVPLSGGDSVMIGTVDAGCIKTPVQDSESLYFIANQGHEIQRVYK